jgi:hypothetical protein
MSTSILRTDVVEIVILENKVINISHCIMFVKRFCRGWTNFPRRFTALEIKKKL